MNIKLTEKGLQMTPENQAEFFQLEILWENREDFRILKNLDSITGDLISLNIEVLNDKNNQ
jgi:hypothetical protein